MVEMFLRTNGFEEVNLRYVRRIIQHKDGSTHVEMDTGERYDLWGHPDGLEDLYIPGDGVARVVTWVWDVLPETDEQITAECLEWYRTRIIGWRIHTAQIGASAPYPLLSHPPSHHNGEYLIEQPDGWYSSPDDVIIKEDGLTEWALDQARSAARAKRRLREDL